MHEMCDFLGNSIIVNNICPQYLDLQDFVISFEFCLSEGKLLNCILHAVNSLLSVQFMKLFLFIFTLPYWFLKFFYLKSSF